MSVFKIPGMSLVKNDAYCPGVVVCHAIDRCITVFNRKQFTLRLLAVGLTLLTWSGPNYKHVLIKWSSADY